MLTLLPKGGPLHFVLLACHVQGLFLRGHLHPHSFTSWYLGFFTWSTPSPHFYKLVSWIFFTWSSPQVGIDNSKCFDSLLLSVLIFITNLFNNFIVLCLSYSIFFNKFIGLKINATIILNKSLPKDFYAMFLTFVEFPTIIASLILWV